MQDVACTDRDDVNLSEIAETLPKEFHDAEWEARWLGERHGTGGPRPTPSCRPPTPREHGPLRGDCVGARLQRILYLASDDTAWERAR
jgi:hypothetical protein